MESQPQSPEFRINPQNIHPCVNLRHSSCKGETIGFSSSVRSVILAFLRVWSWTKQTRAGVDGTNTRFLTYNRYLVVKVT